MKAIWRKNFNIGRVDYNIMVESTKGFFDLAHPTVGKNVKFTKAFSVIQDGNLEGFYFQVKELRAMIERVLEVITQNPSRIEYVHKKSTQLNQEYFDTAEAIRKKNLKLLTNKQLLALHKKLYHIQYTSHGWPLPTTWTSDSDGEDLSKLLLSIISNRIQELNLNLIAPAVFSVLTTSFKETFAQREEKESLAILQTLRNNKKLRHFFMSRTTQEIIRDFSTLPASLKRKIQKHYYRYCWTPYTYVGPAYELDYYIEVWRGLLHEDTDPKKYLAEQKTKSLRMQRERKKLEQQLKLSFTERKIFDIGAEITWLKAFRKDCYYHGFYVMDLLLVEIAKRTQHSLMQMKYLLPKELPLALKGKDFSEIANDRYKYSIIFGQKNRITILTGSKAKKFFKTQKIEKEKIVRTNSLTGTCACPGNSTGVVRVINTPEEMTKMNPGDIMLSHTTFPALVPAMKKASAIVTEDGGITCHAAIVARELQTPCIVGVKSALAIFKDGDTVEVNATSGIIRKLTGKK